MPMVVRVMMSVSSAMTGLVFAPDLHVTRSVTV